MQWQPMETAPKDRAILGLRADNNIPETVIWCPIYKCWQSYIYDYGTDQYGETMHTYIILKYWMELPETPQ